MAATVVAYINRVLDTADAVALTASRHTSTRPPAPRAAAAGLQALVGGRDELLNSALLADVNGQPVAWARPPDPAVEGSIDRAWLSQVARTGKILVSPLLGKAGDTHHSIVLAYAVLSPENQLNGVLGLSVHLQALRSEE